MPHTIVMLHPRTCPKSRTYNEYDCIDDGLNAICKIYEEHLKRNTPNTPQITYDIAQLFDFLDTFVDISCLVFQRSTNTYAPHGKDWIKDKLYAKFRAHALKN